MRALPVCGAVNEESGFFDSSITFDHIAVIVDSQYVAAPHPAPVHAPPIDEECTVAQGVAEVVVNTFVQILVSRYPKYSGHVAPRLLDFFATDE
jgi:hypothetical protein